MNKSCAAIVDKHHNTLVELLAAESTKYSAWSTTRTDHLKSSAGVYHFYESRDEGIVSLYVGKAGFGSGEWSLYKRLSQHFRPSQPNTLLGKMAKDLGRSPKDAMKLLSEGPVYVQWLALFGSRNSNPTTLEKDLVWVECFCKAVLMPRYTDA